MVRICRCFATFGIGVLVLAVASGAEAAQTLYYEGQFQLPIPADAGMTKGSMDDAVLNVPDHVIITDLDVLVTLTHTSVLDLRLLVESPWGRSVLLNMYDPLVNLFDGADYDHTIFDDEAGTPVQSGLPPFAGRFRPLESLSAFDRRDACGAWRLQILDTSFLDRGQLSQFGLFITTTSTVSAPAPSALALVLTACGWVRLGRRHISGRKMLRGPAYQRRSHRAT